MLKEKAIELNVNEQVEFHKNVTYRLVPMALHPVVFSSLLLWINVGIWIN